jgi:3-oxoacyl-[acyl-carrier protein] reductase
MEVRLDGRTAIITGASKGLGLAMAKEFAASGANVAILARSPDTLAEAQVIASEGASGKVATFQCDVSKADDINKTFASVLKTFGQVDILINNAGISRAMASDQITDEIWQDDLDLKLFAAIRLSRLCWPGMKSRKWGRIINVLNSGAKAPRANGAPTAVSRAAGMALMKVMSGEGAPHGILVNGMLVGLISTSGGISAKGPTPAMRSSRQNWVPMCRWGGSARRRNSPRWPVSCAATMPGSPPGRRSTWMAGRRRWFDGRWWMAWFVGGPGHHRGVAGPEPSVAIGRPAAPPSPPAAER